ncbi:MAG: phage Dori [Actinomycetota bacterium]|jgi:hypothetical protein
MSLPWVRLDSSIATNHKILQLVGDRNHKAIAAYMFGLAYCGQHGTDGFIPRAALPFMHASIKEARALVDVVLWHEVAGGWQVNDWRDYQPSSEESDRRGQRARWLNCRRWHPADCDCSPAPPPGRPERSLA